MPLVFLKRSTLPAPVKGKVGSLSVVIGGNGTITLSSLVAKAINHVDKVMLAYDVKSGIVQLHVPTAKLEKDYPAASDWIALRKPKKGNTLAFTGTDIMKITLAGRYDYKASGNQTFPATIGKDGAFVQFTLPEGALTKKAVTPRAKKEKKAAVAPEQKVNGVAANPGEMAGVPVNSDGEELVLEAV